MRFVRLLIFFFLFSNSLIWAQKSLQIFVNRFGKTKKYEVFNNDVLEYKLKGQHFFHVNKIVNLQDSNIVFQNDSVITLNRIKAIRIHTGGHLAKTFQEAFFIAGIGFIALNTANNAIYDRAPVLENKAVYISGALVGTSLLIRLFSTKHLRITKNKILKISVIDFKKLNEK